MKNKLLTLLTLLMVLSFSLGALFACDNGESGGQTPPTSPPEHTHEYETDYTYDANFHWFECSCGDKKQTTEHTFTDNNCVCGYEKPAEDHVHNFSILKFDESRHWYECVCMEKDDEDYHAFIQQIESEKYLESEATCLKKGKYYFSCECSAKGTQTFEVETVSHSYKDGKCKWCSSDEVYSKGLKFDLINNNTEYEVSIGTCTDTEIIIPTIYEGKPVTTIGYSAFSDLSQLKSVVIGNNVKSISDFSFSFCDLLESIVIPNSVEIIGGFAFYYCYSLGNIEIPNSVKSIGNCAFNKCASLKSIEIPNSVVTIGEKVFADCDTLTSIEIANSVDKIGEYALYSCKSLTSITYNGTVSKWNSIEKGAYWNNQVPATEVVCTDGKVSLTN